MATKTDVKTNSSILLWKIENVRHSWLKHYEVLDSPTFTLDSLNGTQWLLKLYLMGVQGMKNYIAVFLYRKKDCSGPKEVIMDYEIGFLSKNGLLIGGTQSKIRFTGNSFGNLGHLILRERVLVTEKEDFLPNDTLTVQCTIWNAGQTPNSPQKTFARSVFKVNSRSFVWTIEKFSSRKSDLIHNFKDEIIDFNVTFNEELDCEKKLVININSFNESIKFFSFKIAIVGIEGERENCGSHKYFADDLMKGIKCNLLFPKKCIENKSRFLPNDILSLDCEYIYSNGAITNELGCCEIISSQSTNKVVKKMNEPDIVKKKSPDSTVILDDFKLMYTDGLLSDTELRNSTKTFPVHQAILSARSPVFKRMFSNDMKEKNSRVLHLTDYDDDSVHHMLLYMYTDSLMGVQFERALKLYSIADKYDILSLKSKCSSFLEENLCPTNVCDVLVLADLHHDDDLKNRVQDFVLENDTAVFRTQEWKDLMNTHLKLAADIMYRKVHQ